MVLEAPTTCLHFLPSHAESLSAHACNCNVAIPCVISYRLTWCAGAEAASPITEKGMLSRPNAIEMNIIRLWHNDDLKNRQKNNLSSPYICKMTLNEYKFRIS